MQLAPNEKTLLYYKSWLLLIFHIIAFFETGVLKQSLYKHMVRNLKAFNYGPLIIDLILNIMIILKRPCATYLLQI